MKNSKYVIGGLAAVIAGAAFALKHKKTIPDGVNAVKPFNLPKYMGKWYEIARLNFHFEKHIDYATAEYELNKDGSVKVVNEGYDYKKQKRVKSVGKALLAGDKDEAKLKVSFWGPFYAGYNVISIDEKYKYALVAGENKKYLWILSREKEIPGDILQSYLDKAERLGFNTKKLVWTKYEA